MKVLIYENKITKLINKSGVGMAIRHQKQALDLFNIEHTNNINDKYDIAHFNYYDPIAYFAMQKLKKQGIPVVVHAHSTEEDFRNSFVFSNQIAPLFKKWLIKFYQVGDALITPTPYAKSLIENYAGITKPITVISNGIDLNKFPKDDKLKEYFNKQHNIDSDDKVIINIGFPIERKGVLDFIEVARHMPSYKFYWIGETPKGLAKYNIKQAITNAPKNCMFLGYQSGKPLAAAFNRADLFFFPSFEETEGIVVLEALAMKIPLLIKDIPVYNEWLENDKNVYKRVCKTCFTKAIKDILDNNLPDLTKAGYKIAESKDINKVAKQLVEFYQDVIKEHTN